MSYLILEIAIWLVAGCVQLKSKRQDYHADPLFYAILASILLGVFYLITHTKGGF